MLDLFAIFTKGGIVLWCFQSTGLALTRAVNSLIKTVILQVCGLLCCSRDLVSEATDITKPSIISAFQKT